MKSRFLRLFVLLLVGLPRVTLAQASARPAPPDTVRGQARLTHRVSIGLCEKLARESQTTDLRTLSSDASTTLLEKLVGEALTDNLAELYRLVGPHDEARAGAIGHDIGAQALLEMMSRCPTSVPFLLRVSKRGGDYLGEVPAAERPSLLPIAREGCHCLDTADAHQPLTQRPPELRASPLRGLLHRNKPRLAELYGPDVMTDGPQGKAIGRKVGLLMLELCPARISQLGSLETSPPPATVRKPAARKAPRRKVPVRTR